MKRKFTVFSETLQTSLTQHRIGLLAGILFTTFVGILPLFLEREIPSDLLSFDLLFNLRGSRPIPNDAVIIYLDEASRVARNQPSDAPWDRSVHAQLLDRLTKDGARAVIFDILFYEKGPDPIADQHFADAIRKNQRVILGGETLSLEEQGQPYKKVFPPYAPFLEAAAGFGFVQLQRGGGLSVRQHLHNVSPDIPSLSWAAARVAGVRLIDTPKSRAAPRWINYYGPAGTLPNFNLDQASEPDGVPPGIFRDKVVFVGAKPTAGFVGTGKDELNTPFTFWSKKYSPGVEIHATSFLNLLRGDWLTRFSAWQEISLVLAWGIVCGAGFVMLRPIWALGLGVFAALLIVSVACFLAWHLFVWFSWIALVLQVAIAVFWSIGFNSIQWYVQREFMLKTLSTHLSPARAKIIMGRPELLRPGADLQPITILFSDIANFTRISEKLPPGVLAELLNKYFEASISSIHKTEGTVVKLIGDAIFAIWNAPEPQSDHNERACHAALLLREQLLKFDEDHKDLPQLRTRVGLHTGVACVGNFGSSTRFDYTAIGDNVNLSSRLEGLNKFLGTDILVSDAIYLPVQDRFTARYAGKFQFKGFERSVEVYELLGTSGDEGSSRSWRKIFEDAIRNFQRREFDAAEKGLIETMSLHSEDGPSQFYLHQIQEFRMQSPGEKWNGAVELKEK